MSSFRNPRRLPGPRSGAGALVLCLAIVLSGCSGGDEEPAPKPSGAASPTASTPTPSAAPPVRTTTEVGEVVGRLPKARRKVVSRHLTRVVDRWWRAAYLSGDYPRSRFGPAAFPGFSPGATRRARHDRDLMSNAAIGSRIESVTAKRRRVALDLLAVDGRVKVATARVSLVFRVTRTSGEKSRPEAVRGRLFITREPAGWRVVGYDVSRGEPRVAEEKAEEKSGKQGKDKGGGKANDKGMDKSRDRKDRDRKDRDQSAAGTGKDGNR